MTTTNLYTQTDLRKMSLNPRVLILREQEFENREARPQYALARDAKGGLCFNGMKFTESLEYLSLPENNKDDFSQVHIALKEFLYRIMFAKFPRAKFENEFNRLIAAYTQDVLGEGYKILHASIDGMPSYKCQHNLTYTDSDFEVVTTMTNFYWVDKDNFDSRMKIPGTLKISTQLKKDATLFSINSISTSNKFLSNVVLKNKIDLDNIDRRGKIDCILNNEALVTNLKSACITYQADLLNSLSSEFRKSLLQPLDGLSLIEESAGFNFNSNSNSMLEILMASPNMEEKMKNFSYSEKLTLKKYKALATMQQNIDKKELAIDKVSVFFTDLEKNRRLFKTNRDNGFITFIKSVGTILSLGILTPILFSTRGERFISKTKLMAHASLQKNFSILFAKRTNRAEDIKILQAPYNNKSR